jgi:protein subunit release factor B
VIVYLPTSRSVTIDMSKLAGPAAAHWYDPTNGTYVLVAGSPFQNVNARQFSPPKHNSAGDGDWILVLETQPRTD